ncbi:MAG: dienelactone hydrolase family protein [Planctomycetaceae bacterium]|jgi:dienelactone hydrolase
MKTTVATTLSLFLAALPAVTDVSWLSEVTTPPEIIPTTDAVGFMAPLLSFDGETVGTVAAWRPRRQQLVKTWSDFLGKVAERPASGAEVLATTVLEGFVRQRLRYENESGQEIEAWLLKPSGSGGSDSRSLPGIVALHQTTQDTIDEIAGLTGPEMQHLGPKLAKRGFVVICPRNYLWEDAPSIPEAARLFLERKPGVLGMSKMVYDARRAVDILESIPGVDPRRIGAIGHSLGAKETLYLAAFDERIRAAVASEGGIAFQSTNWNAPWYLGSTIDRPDCERNHHELLALIAPRPFLILGGETGVGAADGNRSWPLISPAQAVYRLWDQPVRLGLLNHGQGHSIPAPVWEKAVSWLETHLSANAHE